MKNFEERLSRLEELADKIREPKIPLEEALEVFEEGLKLSRTLASDLEKIEARVEILLSPPSQTDAEAADEADKGTKKSRKKAEPEFGLFDGE